MRHKNKWKRREWKAGSLGVATLLAFAFSLSTVTAQESVNATGGNTSGSGGSTSYSVGQLMYQTHTGTNGSVAEGVQQPYEISIVTGIKEANEIDLLISAYPNPASDYLILTVNEFEIENLSYQLYNMNGILLENKTIVDSRTDIVLSNLPPAVYFVKIIQGNKEVKTFKVIKN